MSAARQQTDETNETSHSTDAADQYLTFMLAEEEYAVEILKVQEIMGWEEATPIPNTPDYVAGVVNIRGEIVPVLDLRRRLGLQCAERTDATVVIVVKMNSEEQERTVGLIVDAVSDVYHFDPGQIQATPGLGATDSAEQVRGLATVDEKIVLILDVDRLINFDEIEVSVQSGAACNDIESETAK